MQITSPDTGTLSTGNHANQSPAAENKPKTTAPAILSSKRQLQVAMLLRNDMVGQQHLATRLYQEFQAMKTYGKEPESLESILPLFQSALAEYPVEKIMRALDIHASRSQEFPTRFDIVSLIKRNGKPPLSQAMYVTISKKDGEDRTASDWQYMRDYEAEQHEESCEFSDAMASEANTAENSRLRKEIWSLRDEVKRLGDMLHEERRRNGLERPKPTLQAKINATVDAMRKAGAPEADIEAFMKSEEVAA
jgi:hypothetical protein